MQVTNLISKGQEVVVYPHEVHASNKQLRGIARELASAPRSGSKNHLGRRSGEVHWTEDLEYKQKDTHTCFPPSINAARPASSIVVGGRDVKGEEQERGVV
jgi:hypothetical protein